jgi:hypothetical protein
MFLVLTVPITQGDATLSLSVDSDKHTLLAYEPLPLTFTLTNEGSSPISGEFYLDLWIGQLKIFYRKVSSPFSEYHCLKTEYAEKRNFIHLSKVQLPPGGQRAHREILLFDTRIGGFVLAEPGEYEIKVVFQYVLNDPAKSVESNTILVTVVRAPEEESQVLTVWKDQEIAEIVQGDGGFPGAVENRRAQKKLKEFVEKHSNSIYAQHARDGLLRHLEVKAKHGKLTDEERTLYESLQR